MSADDLRPAAVNRRQLLKLVGAASTATLPLGTVAAGDERAPVDPAPCGPAASSQQMQPPAENATPASTQRAPRYTFFNFEEVLFVEAVVDTLIPSDEVGP